MKLNSIIFCLCAGLCSSSLIDSVFSMNSHSKLDSYSAMIVGKYLGTKQDLVNLVQVKKEFRETIDKYRFNPASISPKDTKLWQQINTLHLYTNDDIKRWARCKKEFFRVEVHCPLTLAEANTAFNKLKKLLNGDSHSDKYVIFNNVTANDDIGHLDENGKFVFDNCIQYGQNKLRASYGTFQVNANYDINDKIKPVYVLRNIKNIDSATKSIEIPNGVRSIDNCTFISCTRLTSIIIPNGVKYIGYSAFSDCTGLTEVILPNGVRYIENLAFECCTGLTSITIPDSIRSIKYNAFKGCSNLEKIYVDSEMVKQLIENNLTIDPDIIEVKQSK